MTDELINEATIEQPVVEETVAPVEAKPEGLSNREALQRAIEEKRDVKPEPQAEISKTEVKQAVAADPDPPAEFSAAGKKAWQEKDISGIQREFRRIHDSRTQEISRAQREAKEARESSKPIKDLADKVKNYLSVRGEGDLADEVKIAQALQLVSELRKGDGVAVKAELKRLGIDLDAAAQPGSAVLDPQIEALQNTVNSLVQEKEAQKYERAAQTFGAIYQNLSSQKTRTGDPVFPGLQDNSEAGIQFGREVGSLT